LVCRAAGVAGLPRDMFLAPFARKWKLHCGPSPGPGLILRSGPQDRVSKDGHWLD